MPNFNVNPYGQQVQVDFAVNLPVQVYRAFAVWTAGNTLVAESALGPATPVGVPDFSFNPNCPLPGTLACLFNCLGPFNLVGEPLNITVRIWQNGGAVQRIRLTPGLMRGKSGNGGVTVAHLQKSAWIGLI
jgi:hypothetical protein